MFLSHEIITNCTWQAFERLIQRLLIHRGYKSARVVGGTGDKGADIIALHPNGKRWLIQAKHWGKPVPEAELQKTIEAGKLYKADIMVVAALNGVDEKARQFQVRAMQMGHNLSVWHPGDLINLAKGAAGNPQDFPKSRDYQEAAISSICDMLVSGSPSKGLVIMATGLGKTYTAAEAVRRARKKRKLRCIVVAHTNSLLLQLEKAFWPFIGITEPTVLWNQYEKPSPEALASCSFVFASRDTLANFCSANGQLEGFDLLLIDECHHAHSKSASYQKIVSTMGVGCEGGPQILGLTATPFLADSEASIEGTFGSYPLVTIDMIYGLKHGFLAQVDYRLYTDNINWEGIKQLKGKALSPKQVNKVFFIKEWDEAVILKLQETWQVTKNPKAIVFCGTIQHAVRVRDRINSMGFCKAEALFSGKYNGESMSQYDRNLILSGFESDFCNVICTVDIFNEGIDVPDVNIIVFNRVTHSRRIFIQQLGRGLRVSPTKEKAIVLDFAQDIRRYAAGLKMKSELNHTDRGTEISIGNKVTFRNSAGEDPKAESFLKAWLQDVESIERSGDDDGVLRFPPPL